MRDSKTCRGEDPTDGRRPTPGRRGPDFLIIGATKSGTTTLTRRLSRHPRIFMTDPKEPNYFGVERFWARGQEWYESLYEGAADDQVAGEASSAGTRWPLSKHVPERIRALYPEARFVYIMRHPVERAFSHYAHNVRDKVDRTFEEALRGSERYVLQGLYMSQIERFLAHFARERFLFLLLEDLKTRPEWVFAELHRFLGVEMRDLPASAAGAVNRGGDVPIASRRLTRILHSAAAVPGLGAISRAIPGDIRARLFDTLRAGRLSRILAIGHRVPPMRPDTRRALLERFRGDTDRLEGFLGRDLSAWKG